MTTSDTTRCQIRQWWHAQQHDCFAL